MSDNDDIPFNRDFPLKPGVADEVRPGVRRVLCNNPSPFTFSGTVSYIVGEGKVAIIDPGPEDEAHAKALLDAVKGETVTHIFVTHTHRDHSPNTARLKAAVRQDFLWEHVTGEVPLVRLARVDARRYAQRVSCDQEIAADGFFSLGMLADFDASLETFGPSFYRHLFWESGVVGQVLYLEAEAAGARGTGIGCFYDDPVHDLFGLTGHAFQSLYHFTVGIPVDDTRLMTKPGYEWEAS